MKRCLLVTFVSLALCFGGCSSRAVGVDHDRDGSAEGDANLNNNSGTPCQNGTCDGCCDPAGNCLPGTADDQCGTGGQECMDCATLGGTCQNGVCVDTDPCGPENCAGCCTTDGMCLAGTTAANCGIGGALCVDCGGLDCVQGFCCEDEDGDGYGPGCPLGDDCDDDAPGIVGACQPNGCPQGWAHVPAGMFIAGCPSAVPGECDVGDTPLHDRFLEAFCVEVTEVSVAAFRQCQDDGICLDLPPPASSAYTCNWSEDGLSDRTDHPINCIPWLDARAYCQDWLGGDLPTEWQWEKAARGTDGRLFPWGDQTPHDCNRCNFCWCLGENQEFYTWPVGYLTGPEGDSPYGVKDMCGNLAEMTRSCRVGLEHRQECELDPDADYDEYFIGRNTEGDMPGGGEVYAEDDFRTYWITMVTPSPLWPEGVEWMGFRCIKEL